MMCIELLIVSDRSNFAPYVATSCLIELANLHEMEFPSGPSILRNQTYMDDELFGADSLEKLVILCD